MPRPRKTNPAADPAQTDIETAIAQAIKVPAVDLITEYRKIETWAEAQDKAYGELMKPHRDRMAEIKQLLLAKAIEEKVNSFPTEAGTAYISSGISHKVDPNAPAWINERGEEVTGREAVLDWLLQNWDDYGAEFAQINLAVDGVKKYIESTKTRENPNGMLPPGISVQVWQRINVRKA